MGKYVLAYRGGTMGETPEEQQEAMTQWMNWFGSLAESVVDGGNPFGPGSRISPDGSVKSDATMELTGYSIIDASDMTDACKKAKGCPVLSGGGSIDVYEAMPIG